MTENPKDKIRVGVVGAGGIANGFHIPSFMSHPNAEVVAICDIDEPKAKETADRYDVSRIYTKYEELFASGEIDAVAVTTPNNMHYPPVMAALEAGLSVICEKPLAMNAQQAREMHELAEKNNLENVVNFTFRGFPASARMRELIDDGYVGEIHLINIQYFADYAMPGTPIRWRQDKPISGSGVLGDLGSHAIDQARLYGGEISRVCAHLLTVAKQRSLPDSKEMVDIHVDDCAALMVEFESGAQGVIHTSWCAEQAQQGQMQDISVYGSEGMLRLERTMTGGDKLVGTRRGTRTMENIPMPPEYEHGDTTFHRHMVVYLPTPPKEFINAICSNSIDSILCPTFFDGLRVQEVMDGALESHETGCWITL